jgi:hypothetical protein
MLKMRNMMSLNARRELLLAIFDRYVKARKSDKNQILNEFVQSSGYNRKYALELLKLRNDPRDLVTVKRTSAVLRRRKYGPDVERSLVFVWRVSGGLCPKRLMPFLPEMIAALERSEEIVLSPMVKQKLLTMSIATVERMLSRVRRSLEYGLTATKAGTLLRHQIPIRTYADWTEANPGFFEIDLVAHCGNTAAGEFVHTLTMTDIETGWTECFAIVNRSRICVVAAIERVRKRIPFPVLGIDCDNGSEFINHHLKSYCDERKITFTRCRPYKKNDQCHVEQKNGAVVRPLVGYARYEGEEATAHLNQLYAVDRLCVNFFEPSMKLINKTRTGAQVKKIYDTPKTPWQRLQDSGTLSNTAKTQMGKRFLALNPAKMRRDLDDLELDLRKYAENNPPPIDRQVQAAEGDQSDE